MKRNPFTIKHLVIGFLFLCFFTVSHQVSALGLVNSSDTLAREKVSEASHHRITFQTPSGINPAETVIFTFPSGFSGVNAITSSDVQIQQNATVFASTNWSLVSTASTLTFTFNTAINPNDVLVFDIGTETPGGVNEITNPSLQGEYIIDIQGSFGDTGLISVPILRDDQVHVTAKVIGAPATTTGGGGGGSRRCRFLSCLFDDRDNNSLVRLQGYSHPNGFVDIYHDGGRITRISTNENGFFTTDIQNFATGNHTFFFVGTDENGQSNIITSITAEVTYNTLTVIEGLLLPATIVVDTLNEDTGIGVLSGETVPFASVDLYANGEYLTTVIANEAGDWVYAFDNLDPDKNYLFSTVIRFNNLVSEESKVVSVSYTEDQIFVTLLLEELVDGVTHSIFNRNNLCITGDVNTDGIVSLQDMSIVAYWWTHQVPEKLDRLPIFEPRCINEAQDLNLKALSIIAYYYQETWQQIRFFVDHVRDLTPLSVI